VALKGEKQWNGKMLKSPATHKPNLTLVNRTRTILRVLVLEIVTLLCVCVSLTDCHLINTYFAGTAILRHPWKRIFVALLAMSADSRGQ